MNSRKRAVLFFMLISTAPALAQHGHMEGHGKGADVSKAHSEKIPPASALKPAEGASVKILAPQKGQVFQGDEIPLHFKMAKGKRGNHVHAYIDGKLMGMFQSEKGTLTGIKPGRHTLELRVVAKDHQVELNATDKVEFVVK